MAKSDGGIGGAVCAVPTIVARLAQTFVEVHIAIRARPATITNAHVSRRLSRKAFAVERKQYTIWMLACTSIFALRSNKQLIHRYHLQTQRIH